MNQLPIFLNLKGRKILLLGRGEMAEAKKRLYERAGAVITNDENASELKLAVVALEDDEEANAAVARLKERGLLVNAVDRPALCDYTTPAIIDRDPVLVAIGTGGASAGLAKALRQRLEQLLPASLGRLADALFDARDQIRKVWPEGAARRKAIDAALDPDGTLDVMTDHMAAEVDDWLDQPHGQARSQVIDMELLSADPDGWRRPIRSLPAVMCRNRYWRAGGLMHNILPCRFGTSSRQLD
jgi:uroporphyrin-III C-methyltransferase/precorrin-2 dehydrogenase/sirohydrochlorin ferrochelatase